MYSPYAVAGYLPAAPLTIKRHLLNLLATGEAVMPLPHADGGGEGRHGRGLFTLLRRSMLEAGWSQESHVSMVDFSSELFGLSTIWLGTDFYVNNTQHDWHDLAMA